MTAQLGGALEDLGRSFFVELTTGNDGAWILVLIRRERGFYAATYRGTLAEVITRARDGARPDDRSR